MKQRKRTFTLIELLVVIAIIVVGIRISTAISRRRPGRAESGMAILADFMRPTIIGTSHSGGII